jgi:hypothetical protein
LGAYFRYLVLVLTRNGEILIDSVRWKFCEERSRPRIQKTLANGVRDSFTILSEAEARPKTVMGLSLRSASENQRYLVAKKGHPLRGFFEDFRYITL